MQVHPSPMDSEYSPNRPLPSVPAPPRHRRLVVKSMAVVVCLAMLARLWHGTGRSDWAAAGVFAAAVAIFCIAQSGWRAWAKGLASSLAGVGMATAFYRFGVGAFVWPAQTPGLEVCILVGLGLAAAAAGFSLGVWTSDRWTAGGLIAGAGAMMLLASCSLLLPPEAAWLNGVREVWMLQGRQFIASGGLWRWGAVFGLVLAGFFLRSRQSCVLRPDKAPLLNWNR